MARQLCEAATTEKDPFLRAALWDEYNEYKKILARATELEGRRPCVVSDCC